MITRILTFAVVTVAACLLAILFRNRVVFHRWAGGWLIVFVLLAVSGILLVDTSIQRIQDTADMNEWPSVSGEVTKSEITDGRNYRPEITYVYYVDRVMYEGVSKMGAPGFGGKNKRFEVAETIVEEYSPGHELSVRYNPVDPSESTLSITTPWSVYTKLSLGLILHIGSLIQILNLLLNLRRRRTCPVV